MTDPVVCAGDAGAMAAKIVPVDDMGKKEQRSKHQLLRPLRRGTRGSNKAGSKTPRLLIGAAHESHEAPRSKTPPRRLDDARVAM